MRQLTLTEFTEVNKGFESVIPPDCHSVRRVLMDCEWSKIAGDLEDGIWRESWTDGKGKIAILKCNSLQDDGSDTTRVTDFKLTGATCYLMAGSLIVLGN